MSSFKKATVIVGVLLMCSFLLFIVVGCGLEQGTYTYEDGSEYVGELKDGLPNGKGTTTWPDGTEYVGELKDGLPNGKGTMSWSDGRIYVGEWKDGKANGQGTMTVPEQKIMDASGTILPGVQPLPVISMGSEYVGEWKDGKPHGQGTVTYTNGTVQKGRWEDGEFVGE